MNPVIPPLEQPVATPRSRRKTVIVIVSCAVAAIALYYILPAVIIAFIAKPVKVEGTAMSRMLNYGDKILVNKRVGSLERDDIVVFLYPEDKSNLHRSNCRAARRDD